MKKGRTVLQAKRYGIHSCGPTTSLISAIRTMVEDEVSSLVVLSNEGYLMGLVTRADILRAHLDLDDWASRQVQEFMAREVPVVSPTTLLIEAARMMMDQPVRQVVVALDEGEHKRPVAILTIGDLAYHLVKAG